MSFFTCPAANNMPGSARISVFPFSRKASKPVRMTGVANSRKPWSTSTSGRRASSISARTANSRIALASRLPWPQRRIPVLPVIVGVPFVRCQARSLVVVDGFASGAQDPPVLITFPTEYPFALAFAYTLTIAFLLDALFGDPKRIYDRVPHPSS